LTDPMRVGGWELATTDPVRCSTEPMSLWRRATWSVRLAGRGRQPDPSPPRTRGFGGAQPDGAWHLVGVAALRHRPRNGALGAIEGIADGAMSTAKVAGGIVADRPGIERKGIASGGYAVVALGHASCALANAWPAVAGSRAVSWIARGGKNPARDSLLAGSVDPSGQGHRPGAGHGFRRGGHRAAARGACPAGRRLQVAIRPQRPPWLGRGNSRY